MSSQKDSNLTQLINQILDGSDNPRQEKNSEQGGDNYDDKEISRDGLAEIKGGVVAITVPQGRGRFPVIIPGEYTVVSVNDQLITDATVVSGEERVEVQGGSYNPEQKVEIEISQDKLTAYLKISRFAGRRYVIEDCQPSRELVIRARLEKVLPPKPVSMEEVEAIIKMTGIKYGLDPELIKMAIEDKDNPQTKIIIARGKPPIDSVKGEITYKFNRETPIKNINPYGEGVIESVEPGTILAVKNPPVRGEEGIDVFGSIIPYREAGETEILVKEGVKTVQNGTVVVATIAGRPVVEGKEGNIFSIVPVHTVCGDVDINVGNIKFKGDIVVQGSVLDGFRLEAGGNIKVLGSVNHAELFAGGNVFVVKNIISSTVRTGGQSLVYKLVMPLLKEIRSKLGNLLEAVEQLKKHPSFSVADLGQGEGRLLQLLIETRYRMLPQFAVRLKELSGKHDFLEEFFTKVVDRVYQSLYGLGPLRLKESKELGEIIQAIDQLLLEISDLLAAPADIHGAYVQNSVLQASGDIVISGTGSIISELIAGRNIIIDQNHGVVRGGHLTASGLIKVKELGSSAETMVNVHLIAKCRLEADLVHPSVIIEHGVQKYRFETWPLRNVEAFENKDGKLVVNGLRKI